MGHSNQTCFCLVAILALLGSINTSPVEATPVPLPGLTGTYEMFPGLAPDFDAPGYRSIDFFLPESITEIEQLNFVISGQWAAGEMACDQGWGPPDISPLLPPLSLLISSSAFPGDFFFATIEVPEGPFDSLTAEFTSCCPGDVLDLDQLIGNDLHAELIMDFAILGICWVTDDTYGTLDDVRLQVIGPVATESISWTEVKSLYR